MSNRWRALKISQTPGISLSKIVRITREEEIYTTKESVRRLINKYERMGGVADMERRKMCKVLQEGELEFVNSCIESNREITHSDLRSKVKSEFGKDVSNSTIIRELQYLGWTCAN